MIDHGKERRAKHEEMETMIVSLCPAGVHTFFTDGISVLISTKDGDLHVSWQPSGKHWSVHLTTGDPNTAFHEKCGGLDEERKHIGKVRQEDALRMALQFIQGEPMR